MSNTSPLNASTPRASAGVRGTPSSPAAPRASAPAAARNVLTEQLQGLETLVVNKGEIKAVTQNPSAPLPPTRLQQIRNALNKPVFTWKNDQAKKDDFFAGAKGLVNNIWTNKLAINASGAVGGGIATAVIFGLLYKAAIIGALGAFFSTHVGWAVAAGIGGALLVAGIVVLVRRAQHKDDIKDRNARQAHGSTEAKRQNLEDGLRGGVEMLKELAQRVEGLEGDARFQQARKEGLEAGRQEGYAQGHSAGYEQGHGEGQTQGVHQGIRTARQAQQVGDRPAAPGPSADGAANSAPAARAAAPRPRSRVVAQPEPEAIDPGAETDASYKSSRTSATNRSSDDEGGTLPPEMMAQLPRRPRSQSRQRSARRA